MDIKELEQIIGILKHSDITEFELEHNGTHVRLTRGMLQRIAASSTASEIAQELKPAIVGGVNGAAHLHHESAAPSSESAISDKFHRVESPLVGTFYRRPSPDAEPFVKEGDVVSKGDTLCIVEAMKLMNEIEAPASGKIEKILASDTQVVEYGEVLFLINPSQ